MLCAATAPTGEAGDPGDAVACPDTLTGTAIAPTRGRRNRGMRPCADVERHGRVRGSPQSRTRRRAPRARRTIRPTPRRWWSVS